MLMDHHCIVFGVLRLQEHRGREKRLARIQVCEVFFLIIFCCIRLFAILKRIFWNLGNVIIFSSSYYILLKLCCIHPFVEVDGRLNLTTKQAVIT